MHLSLAGFSMFITRLLYLESDDNVTISFGFDLILFVGEQKVFVSNIVFLFSGWGGGETTSHSWLTTLLLLLWLLIWLLLLLLLLLLFLCLPLLSF